MKLYRLDFAANNGGTLEALRDLTDSEADDYLRSCRHLLDFEQARDMLVFVSDSLEAFRFGIAEREEQARVERISAFDQDPRPRQKLQRLAADFLNSMRLYLDHGRTHLSRKYGKTSNALAAFDKARRMVHDREPLYRFAYELRNFVQHCGMPLQRLRSIQRMRPNDDTAALTSECFFGFTKGALLEQFDGWRHGRAFIDLQRDEFEALPIFERTTELLWEIEQAAVRALLPELWHDAKCVVRLLEEGTDATGMGMPAEFIPTSETAATLSLKAPPFDILAWLKLIVMLDHPPGIRFNQTAMAAADPPTSCLALSKENYLTSHCNE